MRTISIPISSPVHWLKIGAQSWAPAKIKVGIDPRFELRAGGTAEAVFVEFVPASGVEGKYVILDRAEAAKLGQALIAASTAP